MKMRPLSYRFRSRVDRETGTPRSFVEATCATCGAVEEVPWSGDNVPDAIARKFVNAGWEFNKFKPRGCRCRQCVTGGEEVATNVGKSPELVKGPTPSPTRDQRSAIRRMLDLHFDDDAGVYLDGKSDQLVGAELDIPWKVVFEVREAAYGPLRGDEQMSQAETKLAELEKIAVRLSGEVAVTTRELGEVKADLARLRTVMDTVRKRFAA